MLVLRHAMAEEWRPSLFSAMWLVQNLLISNERQQVSRIAQSVPVIPAKAGIQC